MRGSVEDLMAGLAGLLSNNNQAQGKSTSPASCRYVHGVSASSDAVSFHFQSVGVGLIGQKSETERQLVFCQVNVKRNGVAE